MRFTTIGYIAASVALSVGTVLWFDREDDTPQPQDFLELMNAVQERCLATRFATNGIYPSGYGWSYSAVQPVVMSNGDYSILAGGEDSLTFFVGTNVHPYSIPILQACSPYTNRIQVGGVNDLVISFNPLAYAKTQIENDPTNRWVLGVYSNFTINGFADSDYNGIYTIAGWDWWGDGSIPLYTNSAGISLWYSSDDNKTYFSAAGDPWELDYQMSYPPWFGMPVTDFVSYGADFPITCSKGPLDSRYNIEDRPCYRKTYVYDWTLDNRKPSFNEFILPIDDYIFGTCLHNDDGGEGWFTGWVYSPSMRPSRTPITQGYHSHAYFIEPTMFGVSTFSQITDLDLDLARWGLTNTYVFHSGTNDILVTGFDDHLRIPNTNDNFGSSTHIISPSAYSITKHALDQRYAALQKCQALRMQGGQAQWKAPYPNNTTVSGWKHSTVSYADACAQAVAGCTNGTTEDGPPYSYAQGAARVLDSYGTITWYCRIYQRDSKMTMYFDTNTACEIAAYLKATANGGGNYVFQNDCNVGLTENTYCLIDQITSGIHYSYEKLIVNATNNLPPDPMGIEQADDTESGYQVSEAEILTKWDFRYCRP